MFKLALFDFYLIDFLEIYRDGRVGYRKSTYKFSSHSEKFYIFTKITKFCLNYTIALFYILVLVM